MINSAFFIGSPLSYKGFKIYPPLIKEIVETQAYPQYLRILTFSQEEIEDEFADKGQELKNLPTPLEFLLANCYNSSEVSKLTNSAFKFFFHSEVTFCYDIKSIVLTESVLAADKPEDLLVINESNFFEIQNLIRESAGQERVARPNPNEHPKIKAMKAKARLRDRIKAKQNKGISLSTSLTAICCMGLGITPLNVGEMSYVAVNAIMQMYQEKEKYQIDIDSLLAGADSKKIKPKYWIRNLD